MTVGRPVRLRMKLERGKLRVTTYAMAARGARRTVGTILIEPDALEEALTDPTVLMRLGLLIEKPKVV